MSFDWNLVNNAESSDHPRRLGIGLFTVEIVRCLEKITRKGDTAFIVEFKLLTSTSPENPAGTMGSWYQSVLGDTGPGHVNAFVLAAYGLKKEMSAEIAKLRPQIGRIIQQAVGVENAFAKRLLHLETYNHVTKAGTDFTVFRWSPFDGGDAMEFPPAPPVEIAPPPPPPKPIFANGKWVLP